MSLPEVDPKKPNAADDPYVNQPKAEPQCFVAGTLVAAEDGLKPIEQVEAGAKVWAYDLQRQQWSLCKVLEPLQHAYEGDLITISVAGEQVESTGNHPFWVVEGRDLQLRPTPDHVPAVEITSTQAGRWVDARNLKVGDVLLLRSGSAGEVESLAVRQERLTVYNLGVEGLQTYAVGSSGVLVHNKPGGPKETFDNAADAIGDLNGNATEVITSRQPTKDPMWQEWGYTEHRVYRDSNGDYHHVFYNPKTQQFSGGGPSSHLD